MVVIVVNAACCAASDNGPLLPTDDGRSGSYDNDAGHPTTTWDDGSWSRRIMVPTPGESGGPSRKRPHEEVADEDSRSRWPIVTLALGGAIRLGSPAFVVKVVAFSEEKCQKEKLQGLVD